MAIVSFDKIKINCDEYGSVNDTITLSTNDPLFFVKVLSVTIPQTFDTLNISFTDTAVTFNGTMGEVFDRSVYYKDLRNVSHTVKRFSDLPSEFMAVYKYVAPTASILELPITITYYHFNIDPLIATPAEIAANTFIDSTNIFSVRNNWQISNAALVESVSKGLY